MPKNLLLADDSVVIQKLVALSFANEDVELVTTDNGDDALARARELTPDLVLADVVMPGKSGYEVCEAIRQDPALRHIPVLLLTGTFEAFDAERAQQVQCDGHITKPFEAQALVDRVKELLASGSRVVPADDVVTAPPAEPEYDFFDSKANDLAADPTPVPPQSAPEGAFSFGGSEELMPAAPEAIDADPLPLSGGQSADPTVSDAGGDRTVAFNPNADGLGLGADPLLAPSNANPVAADPMDFDSGDPLADMDLGEVPGTDAPLATPHSAPPQHDPLLGGSPSLDPAVSFGDQPAPLVPQHDPAATILADDLFGDASSPLASDVSSPAIAPEDDFDFAASGTAAAPASNDPLLGSDDLLGETRLAPEAGNYDVSSSDLGDPLGAAPDLPAASPSAPFEMPEPPAAHPAAPFAAPEMGVPEPFAAPPTASPEPFLAAEPPTETVAPEPAAFFEPPAPAIAVDEPTIGGLGSPNDAPRPDLTPMMRDRIHETLEKVAWEAFSDLSDTIVREVLKKVERVAWEVIPQMAESMIQEEIRRMKDETE